jgi:hypothetical protein
MRKIFYTLALLGMGSAAVAQGLKIGPEVGVGMATMYQTIDGDKYDHNYKLNFRAGVALDLRISTSFYLQSGLFISGKNGTETKFQRTYKIGSGLPGIYKDKRDYEVTYLNVPVYFLYKTGKEFDDPHLFFGIGPSFNYAIGGRYNQEFTNGVNGVDRPTFKNHSIDLGNEFKKDNLRAFDIGANVTVGYQTVMGLYFRGYWGIGLLNLTPSGDKDNQIRNFGGGISVGYLFNTSDKPHWERRR